MLYNRFLGIQLDTLNKICIYLDVTPNELLAFIPYNINIENAHVIEWENGAIVDCDFECEFNLVIETKKQSYSVRIIGKIYYNDPEDTSSVRESFCFLYCLKDQEYYHKFASFFKSLPIQFQTEITENIRQKINDLFSEMQSKFIDIIHIDYPEYISFKGLEEK